MGAMLALAGLSGVTGFAGAQGQYPNRPLRMVVGYSPGGAGDYMARLVGRELGERFQQQVVIENRPGANGIIGAELVAKAPPDGYTLLLAPAGHTVNASLHSKLPYDPVRDFSAVNLVALIPNVLAVHPSIPAKTVSELIALVRAKPDQLVHASSGTGTPGHLSGEVLKQLTGVRFIHAPYKGAGQALTDLLGGHVHLAFPTVVAAMPQLKARRLRALAVTSAKRSLALPDVPTVSESGVKGYEVVGWYGVLAPARVPKDIVSLLNDTIWKILQAQDVRERLLREGAEPVGMSVEEFGSFLVSDLDKWAKIAKAAGLRPDQ
ncbi:MAG: tripartite tricarboxylate transporter substrate binding protein [Betaproteobacteria bacterium]|nr:tripartite tricarboxylate transporter substrate binding protein [Betaproteobacteria bacterium]